MTAAPDYAELVKWLRTAPGWGVREMRETAADAIESLAARVAELERERIEEGAELVPLYAEVTDLRARISALEAERVELLADFERYADHGEMLEKKLAALAAPALHDKPEATDAPLEKRRARPAPQGDWADAIAADYWSGIPDAGEPRRKARRKA